VGGRTGRGREKWRRREVELGVVVVVCQPVDVVMTSEDGSHDGGRDATPTGCTRK